MESISRFFRRISLSYKQSSVVSNWKTFFLTDLSLPIFQMFCYALLGSYIYGVKNISDWMIGNVLLISSFGAIYRVGFQIVNEKNSGTLSLLVASKTKISEVFLSSALSSMVSSYLSVIIGMSLISVCFQISWNINRIVGFLLIVFIAVFVSICFGFLFSCFVLISTEVHLLVNTMSNILLVFTGANFPINHLPNWLQSFSKLLPLTRTIKVAQSLVDGVSIMNQKSVLVAEIMLGFIYLCIGAIVLQLMEYLSIKKGTLDLL